MIKNQEFNILTTKNRPRNKTKLIYESAPKTPEADFSGLQHIEIRLFLCILSIKTYRRRLRNT